jgi:hypothetical protein
VAGKDMIPLDVRITVCTECGKFDFPVESCRQQGHRTAIVHYEISADQNDPVAIDRVADVQRHGRRLVTDQPDV